MKTEMIITDVSEIATIIGIPQEEWEGNCHAISYQIVDSGIVDGYVERGHYYGEIVKGSWQLSWARVYYIGSERGLFVIE